MKMVEGRGDRRTNTLADGLPFVGIRTSGAQGAAYLTHSQHEWSAGIAFVSTKLINHPHVAF